MNGSSVDAVRSVSGNVDDDGKLTITINGISSSPIDISSGAISLTSATIQINKLSIDYETIVSTTRSFYPLTKTNVVKSTNNTSVVIPTYTSYGDRSIIDCRYQKQVYNGNTYTLNHDIDITGPSILSGTITITDGKVKVTNQDGTMGAEEIPITSLTISIINSQVDSVKLIAGVNLGIVSNSFPIALGLFSISADNITINTNL